MADLVEEMITHVAQTVFGTLTIEHPNGKKINLARPWRRIRLADLVANWTRDKIGVEWRFEKKPIKETENGHQIFGALCRAAVDPETREKWIADAHKQYPGDDMTQEAMIRGWANSSHAYNAFAAALDALTPAEQLQKVYEKFIEPTLIDPTYVTHVPSVIIPLARKAKDDPFFADVYELAINGQEISPGYSELNDPDVQAANFAHQVGEDQQKTDDDFLNALRHGMPPAGGMGLGIDRLVMMLTGAESIRDVILFPLMKPQDKHAAEPANPT
jgi:lysyl-tRNA synthetase class 2